MPAPRPPASDAVDTRARILETAARLFHENGYHATGVAVILRESGVNSGSLYHFFKSKEDLLRGVVGGYHEMLEQSLVHCREAEPDPVARVFYMLGMLRERFLAAGLVRGCPVGNLVLELSDSHPDIRVLLDDFFTRWREEVAVWLAEPEARLADDVQPCALACFVLSVIEGALMQSRAAGCLNPIDGAIQHLRRYVESLRESAA